MAEDFTKIKSRVIKLLALAKSPFEKEAQAAQKKAMALIEKYKLSEQDYKSSEYKTHNTIPDNPLGGIFDAVMAWVLERQRRAECSRQQYKNHICPTAQGVEVKYCRAADKLERIVIFLRILESGRNTCYVS